MGDSCHTSDGANDGDSDHFTHDMNKDCAVSKGNNFVDDFKHVGRVGKGIGDIHMDHNDDTGGDEVGTGNDDMNISSNVAIVNGMGNSDSDNVDTGAGATDVVSLGNCNGTSVGEGT